MHVPLIQTVQLALKLLHVDGAQRLVHVVLEFPRVLLVPLAQDGHGTLLVVPLLHLLLAGPLSLTAPHLPRALVVLITLLVVGVLLQIDVLLERLPDLLLPWVLVLLLAGGGRRV